MALFLNHESIFGQYGPVRDMATGLSCNAKASAVGWREERRGQSECRSPPGRLGARPAEQAEPARGSQGVANCAVALMGADGQDGSPPPRAQTPQQMPPCSQPSSEVRGCEVRLGKGRRACCLAYCMLGPSLTHILRIFAAFQWIGL